MFLTNGLKKLKIIIKQVKKLREVMVLRGFRRILPVSENDAEERQQQGLSNDDFAPLSKQPLNWYLSPGW